jgi:hypothetical protein
MKTMKKVTCAVLAVAVMSAAVPVRAADVEATRPAPAEVKPAADARPIADAIRKAGAGLSDPQTARRPAAQAQKVPTSLPKSGSNRIRKQGGSTGMIIGLVTALVGVGATVYMVKEMNKDNDNDQ